MVTGIAPSYLVETHWDHPSLKGSTTGLPVCQNSLEVIMSCARAVLALVVADGQGLIRSKKQKATAKDGLIACYVWLPRAGFESTPRELAVVLLGRHWGANKLDQLNQLHNYTAPDVNMLHIAGSSAENSKIKGM
ncbi:MAG TPA: hypothetical protein VLS47_09130 [Gallionella sp.]|nr:hypothetical protein [Gallionella sp.]